MTGPGWSLTTGEGIVGLDPGTTLVDELSRRTVLSDPLFRTGVPTHDVSLTGKETPVSRTGDVDRPSVSIQWSRSSLLERRKGLSAQRTRSVRGITVKHSLSLL